MIAVTGCTGFLGFHFLKALQERSIPAVLLIRAGSPHENRLEESAFTRFAVDFNRPESIASALRGCEILVHILGLINGSEQALEEANVKITQRVVDAAAEAGIQKIIYISSAAAIHPHGSYGRSKAKGEEILRASGIPYLIFRPAYIYGKGDENNTELMIRIIKHFPIIPLLGGGDFKIQPVYIDDVVDLVIQGLFFSRINQIYTVAGPEKIALRAMFRIVVQRLGLTRWFLPIPLKPVQWFLRAFYFLFSRTRIPVKQILELDTHKCFDISETCRDFKFDPIPFEEGAELMFRP